MAFEFSKTKVEKLAKSKERTLDGTLGTENKSAMRAVARWQAAQELYGDFARNDAGVDADDMIAEGLVIAFYSDAKFQPSWKETLEKHAPALLARMQTALGTPQPRGRRPATVEVTASNVGQTDPDAILGTDSTVQSTN